MVYNEKLLSLDILIISQTFDFTGFLALFHKKFVFLLMVYSEKPKNVTKAIIRKTLDFTGLNDIFSQKNVFL